MNGHLQVRLRTVTGGVWSEYCGLSDSVLDTENRD